MTTRLCEKRNWWIMTNAELHADNWVRVVLANEQARCYAEAGGSRSDAGIQLRTFRRHG